MESPERHVTREEVVEHRDPVVPAAAPDPVLPAPAYNYRAVQIVWFITGLIVGLIAIRFALKLLGASLSSPFTGFMYGLTDPLVAPFRAIFPTTGQSAYIFEPASLVAIVIYALIGWALVSLVRIMTAPRSRRPFA